MKRFTPEWWDHFLAGRSEPAFEFNPNTNVFSEMAVRAIVLEVLQEEEKRDSKD